MPRAVLRGHLIHYQQIGRGPDVVLIHGLFCNIAFWWFRVAPKLAERYRVTALDLRGHGFSGMPNVGYRAVDLAEDVAALMQHLGVARAHLIAHSFGGAVALALAAEHPEMVTRITLADAWVPTMQALSMNQDDGAWPRIQASLRERGIELPIDLPKVAQGFFEELLTTDEGVGNRVRDASMIAAMPLAGEPGRPSRTLRRWRELMARTSAQREVHDPTGLGKTELQRIAAPVDLVFGARSRFLKSRDGLAELLAQRRLVTVPEVGHFFPLLRPDALLHALDSERTWVPRATVTA